MEYLTVMLGRVSPLGVEIDAVVVRIPSHVIPVRKGCHRQWRRHRHARSLVSDTEYQTLHIFEVKSGRLRTACSAREHHEGGERHCGDARTTFIGGSCFENQTISLNFKLP